MSNFAHDDMAKMKQRNKTVTILSSGIQLGSVYFVVKTMLDATTERKLKKTASNYTPTERHPKDKMTPKEHKTLI